MISDQRLPACEVGHVVPEGRGADQGIRDADVIELGARGQLIPGAGPEPYVRHARGDLFGETRPGAFHGGRPTCHPRPLVVKVTGYPSGQTYTVRAFAVFESGFVMELLLP